MKRTEMMIKMAQGKVRNVKRDIVGGVVIAAATAATAAHAEGIDVTTVVTAITAAGVAIATVGAAVLVVKVGGKVWQWVRGAL